MPSQRFIVATLAGSSSTTVVAYFQSWTSSLDKDALDRLCVALRANALFLSVVYYCEWVDRWSMVDLVPGLLEGEEYQATCFTPVEAAALSEKCGEQWPEQEWMAARLREASESWRGVAEPRTVVVIRKVLGSLVGDEEVIESMKQLPDWLEPPPA